MLCHHHLPARPTVATRRLNWQATPLVALLLLALAVLVTGCSGTPDSSGALSDGVTQRPAADEVHQKWVFALRDGDADAALALVDPDLPERAQFAREAVTRMQDYMTNPASPTGALQGVTIEQVSDSVGRSIWEFSAKRWCYRAELVSRGERWYVSRWGQTSVGCS
jgi:hypothetical protein